jgi:hypothetical protein
MIAGLITRSVERRTGTGGRYLTDLARASTAAFAKFCCFLPMARHGAAATAEARAVAQLVATLHEDCGGCVQAVVTQARAAGVAPAILKAVIDGHAESLSDHLAEIHAFARAVVTAAPDAAQRAVALKQRLGAKAQAEIALAIASARVFPTLKRGLGHAVSCSAIELRI